MTQKIFTVGQKFVLDIRGNNVVFKVLDLEVMSVSKENSEPLLIKAGMNKEMGGGMEKRAVPPWGVRSPMGSHVHTY